MTCSECTAYLPRMVCDMDKFDGHPPLAPRVSLHDHWHLAISKAPPKPKS
jgi:hypothetical protein